MAVATAVVIAGPTGIRLYGGRFGPAVLAGSTTLGDASAVGDLAVASISDLSGAATLSSLVSSGTLAQNPATNLSGGATLASLSASGTLGVPSNLLPAWLSASAGQWAQIPNTTMPLRLQDYSGVGWREDSTGLEMAILLAGGHQGNGSDNSVVVWQLMQDAPSQITRIPAANTAGTDLVLAGDGYFVSDGSPIPRHTYQDIFWIPSQQAYHIGGRFWGTGGSASIPETNRDKMIPVGTSSGSWAPKDTLADRPFANAYCSVHDKYTNLTYALPGTVYGDSQGATYNVNTNTWSTWTITGTGNVNTGGNALDTRRGFIFSLGGGGWFTTGATIVAGKMDPVTKVRTPITFNASQAWTDFQVKAQQFLYNTVVYDDEADRYYCFNGITGTLSGADANRIWMIVPNDTNTWDMQYVSVVGAVNVSSTANNAGAQNRFYYSKKLKAFVYSVAGQNIYYMRVPFASSLQVRSGATAGTLPYTATVLPLRGEVPSGYTVTSPEDSTLKATVLSTHEDGSAAVVVLAGETSVTANSTKRLSLGISAASGDTPLTASRIAALVSSVTVNFSGTYGSASIPNLAAPEFVWWANSRVICARYRVAAPTPGTTALEAVIDITAFPSPHNRALVEVVIENGKLDALNSTLSTKPTDATYSAATVTVNGVQIGTASSAAGPTGVHQAFRSWYCKGWLGGDPVLRVTQYHKDLQRHPLFWRFDKDNTATLTAYASDAYTPWSVGRHRGAGNMGGGGVDDTIGPLTVWDARALQTGDYRVWNACEQNALAILTFNINYRDTTGLVPDSARMPNKCQASSRANWPSSSGVGTPDWDNAHQPSTSLVAFLGRPSPVYIEIAQKVAVWSGTSDSTNDRLADYNFTPVGLTDLTGFQANGQARAYAWGMRNLAHAVFLSPDGSSWKAGGRVWLGRQARYGKAITLDSRANLNLMWTGAPGYLFDHDSNTVPGYQLSTFMHHYATGEAHKTAAARLLTNATEQAYLDDFADWICTGSVRWINELPNGSWRFASYDFSYLKADGVSTFASFAAARANDVSGSGPSSATGSWVSPTFQAPSTWTQWNALAPTTSAGTGYEAPLWYSLVCAVERNLPNSLTAWQTVVGSGAPGSGGITDLNTWRNGFTTDPHWNAWPRNL